MGQNFLPKLRKNVKVETWSWEHTINNQWCVYANEYQRLQINQRQSLMKWAKRSCKKKKGIFQPQTQLVFNRYSKPLGVRMGSGRGKSISKFSWVRPGVSIVNYLDIKKKSAENVVNFFKKSNLKLKLVKKKL